MSTDHHDGRWLWKGGGPLEQRLHPGAVIKEWRSAMAYEQRRHWAIGGGPCAMGL